MRVDTVMRSNGIGGAISAHRKQLLTVCCTMALVVTAPLALAQATSVAKPQSQASPSLAPTQTAPTQTAPAQNPTAADAAAPTIKAFSNEVDLVFTVTDGHGKFIKGLNQQNFGLLDDGRPPEAGFHFCQCRFEAIV